MNVAKQVQSATLHVSLLIFVQHRSEHHTYHRKRPDFQEKFQTKNDSTSLRFNIFDFCKKLSTRYERD